MKTSDPIFHRNDVADILDVTVLTITNREKKGLYPEPRRDLNNYRIYSLNDIFNLQMITFGYFNPKPVVELLYDKGYTDPKKVTKMISDVISPKAYHE